MNGYDGGNVHDVGDYYYYYGDAGAAWLDGWWVACLGSNTLPLHHLFIIVYMYVHVLVLCRRYGNSGESKPTN